MNEFQIICAVLFVTLLIVYMVWWIFYGIGKIAQYFGLGVYSHPVGIAFNLIFTLFICLACVVVPVTAIYTIVTEIIK